MGRGAVLATNAFLKKKHNFQTLGEQVGSGGAFNVEGWVEFSGRWEGKRPAADHNFSVHIKANKQTPIFVTPLPL